MKLGRSAHFVEREFVRADLIRPFAPVVATALRYIGDRPVLVMPFVSGLPLTHLAAAEPRRFQRLLNRTVGYLRDACVASQEPYSPAQIEFTTQTPAILRQRLEPLIERAKPAMGRRLGSPAVHSPSLGAAAEYAQHHLDRSPQWTAIYNADARRTNTWYAKGALSPWTMSTSVGMTATTHRPSPCLRSRCLRSRVRDDVSRLLGAPNQGQTAGIWRPLLAGAVDWPSSPLPVRRGPCTRRTRSPLSASFFQQ